MTPEEIIELKKIIVKHGLSDITGMITSISCYSCYCNPSQHTNWEQLKSQYKGLNMNGYKHYAIWKDEAGKYSVFSQLDGNFNYFTQEEILGEFKHIEHDVKLGENYVEGTS